MPPGLDASWSRFASVLDQIARVLKPGGAFLAVINRALHDPAYEVYRRELHRITAELGLERLVLGDQRVFTAKGLNQLIRTAPGFADEIAIDDFEIQTTATPARLSDLLSRTYDVFRLPESAQASFQARLVRAWQPLCDNNGQLTCTMGMRLVKCQTSRPNSRQALEPISKTGPSQGREARRWQGASEEPAERVETREQAPQ